VQKPYHQKVDAWWSMLWTKINEVVST